MSNRPVNAIIGQSGGPTSAINATLAGIVSAINDRKSGVDSKIDRVYGMKNGIDGFLRKDIMEIGGVLSSEENIKLLCQTPAAALGSCRKQLPPLSENPDIYEKIFDILEEYNIGYFFYIGGNDSMDTADKLNDYAVENGKEIKFIGLPKTIDNDLFGTDHAPGFGSAAKYIATTVCEIVRDCAIYTMPAVTIVEVMGRGTGWLAASAAIPSRINGEGPDLVYFPERVFSIDGFIGDVKSALSKHPNVVVAVSEGLKTATGEYISETTSGSATDAFGHKFLSGTAKSLEHAVKEKIGCKVRSIEISLPQRCGAHLVSACDIKESFGAGETAVKFALEGKSGIMVSFIRGKGRKYSITYGETPLSSVANSVVMMPDEFLTPDGNYVSDKGLDYLVPLIQGEMEIVYKDGLPAHFKF